MFKNAYDKMSVANNFKEALGFNSGYSSFNDSWEYYLKTGESCHVVDNFIKVRNFIDNVNFSSKEELIKESVKLLKELNVSKENIKDFKRMTKCLNISL